MRDTWVLKEQAEKKAGAKTYEAIGMIRAQGQPWLKHPRLEGVSRAVELQFRALTKAAGEEPATIALTSETGRHFFGVTLDFTRSKNVWGETLRKGIQEWVTQAGGLALLLEKGLEVSLESLSQEHQEAVISALGFLAATQAWKPRRFTKKNSKGISLALSGAIQTTLPAASARALLNHAQALGECNNQVRTWSTLPPNILNPAGFKKELEAFARKNRLKTQFFNRRALEKMKAGAFLAVMRADPQSEGGILKLSYRPTGKGKKASQRPIALVGKGLCYDTGGYNIKTGSYMFGMHQDMSGAAVAAAYLGYLRAVQYPYPVDAYLAIAQNLVSQHGYTPNEVVHTLDGTSIEVVDTDAEGRMVLSDTLAFVRKQKPRLVIDYATLTGTAIRALGHTRSAVFSNDSTAIQNAVQAGEASGELVWPFPCGEEYEAGLESEVADLLQCSHDNACDHIYAATFLKHFIGKEIPWVHVDLSAQSRKGGLGLIGSECTGFGILWTEAFLRIQTRKS